MFDNAKVPRNQDAQPQSWGISMSEREQVEITSRAQLRRWLAKNHLQRESIWLVTYRKGSSAGRHVPYDELVEEALCFGWVDSQPRALDDDRSMRLLSPRKPGSGWSALNKQRVQKLTAAGKMHASGLASVAAARKDGSWGKLDAVEALEMPADLQAALLREPKAQEYFEAFPRSTRRAILEWIGNAKQDATRRRRIDETVAQAANNIRANQYRQPKGAAR